MTTSTTAPSSSTDGQNNCQRQDKRQCYLCQRLFFAKSILRILIRDFLSYMTLHIVKLNILDGAVISHKERRVHFLRLSDGHSEFYPTQEDFTRIRSPGKLFEKASNWCVVHRPGRDPRPRRRSSTQREEQDARTDNWRVGTINLFIQRLAESLRIDIYTLEETLDNLMTSTSEILLDIDFCKLIRSTGQSEGEIEYSIIDMFWLPIISRSDDHSDAPSPSRIRSRSVPRDQSTDNGWFQFVDRGRVVPFQSTANAYVFKRRRTIKDLFSKCIHEIEESVINAFSWYLNEYFYHDFVFPRITLSYPQYSSYKKAKKICNPRVIVVKDNPLQLGTHFAYVLAQNFHSHHKYVQRYMQDIGLLFESIIRIEKDIPFIVRSLNPITRTHIFHMVYKRNYSSRPSYENVFKSLIMLRDVMFRMRLKDISMCKIGCYCERLSFSKVLRMTEYVFFGTDINVRIGLNLMECWRFRSRSLRNRENATECADISLERINIADNADTDVSSSDEE